MWNKVPEEITDELKTIRKFTQQTNREAAITICKKPDRKRLFVSSSVKGQSTSISDPLTCSLYFGESNRVGDIHTHPTDKDTLGIIPSGPDIKSTLEDSFYAKSPQISCVTNAVTPLMECYIPKAVPDIRKVREYDHKLFDYNYHNDPSFYMDNFGRDFEIGFYDTKNGKKISNPPAKEVVKAAFGASNTFYKKDVKELERGGFCQFIQSFSKPTDDNVAKECVKTLKKKDFFSWLSG